MNVWIQIPPCPAFDGNVPFHLCTSGLEMTLDSSLWTSMNRPYMAVYPMGVDKNTERKVWWYFGHLDELGIGNGMTHKTPCFVFRSSQGELSEEFYHASQKFILREACFCQSVRTLKRCLHNWHTESGLSIDFAPCRSFIKAIPSNQGIFDFLRVILSTQAPIKVRYHNKGATVFENKFETPTSRMA